MTLAQIANKKACSGISNTVNTGKLGCLSLFGVLAHVIFLQKGTVIPAATTFNDAFTRPQVQTGKMIPVIDAEDFEDVSAEDGFYTNKKGRKRLNLKGLPEYQLMYQEGHEWYRQIAKLESFKNYDVILGDEDGNWMMATTSSGDYKGFDIGHVTPMLTKRKVDGGDPEMKAVMFQGTNRLQWDKNYAIVHAEDIDFTPQEFPVINGVNMSFDAIPSDGSTTFDVTVVLAQDNSTGVEGLTDSDFVYTVNGATTVTSVVDNGNGNYTFTVAAVSSTEVLTLDLFHGATNTNVADSNNVLYRAKEVATETVS